MSSDATLAKITPYLEEVLENGYAREQLRGGGTKLRSAVQHARKSRVKPASDKKIRRELTAAQPPSVRESRLSPMGVKSPRGAGRSGSC